jgi:phosphoribosylamine---glycine ligase
VTSPGKFPEGHEVRYYIKDQEEADIADGFVAKSENPEKDAEWADIVVFDDTLGQREKAQALRAQGKKVIGGSAYSDRLEDDRSFGQEELKKAGVNIIPYREFDSFDEAMEHVVKNPDRYVIKPSGEAQNVKRRLFVGEEEDGQDVIRMLDAYKRAFSDEIKVFQLQRRVTGVEVAVGAFFNSKQFIYPVNINFEHKKLFPGNLGPPTGEMGTFHVLESAQPALQPDPAQDGIEPGGRRLRRIHRRELHREWQRHLSAGVHRALRVPHHQYSTGRDDNSHRPVLLGPGQRQ